MIIFPQSTNHNIDVFAFSLSLTSSLLEVSISPRWRHSLRRCCCCPYLLCVCQFVGFYNKRSSVFSRTRNKRPGVFHPNIFLSIFSFDKTPCDFFFFHSTISKNSHQNATPLFSRLTMPLSVKCLHLML